MRENFFRNLPSDHPTGGIDARSVACGRLLSHAVRRLAFYIQTLLSRVRSKTGSDVGALLPTGVWQGHKAVAKKNFTDPFAKKRVKRSSSSEGGVSSTTTAFLAHGGYASSYDLLSSDEEWEDEEWGGSPTEARKEHTCNEHGTISQGVVNSEFWKNEKLVEDAPTGREGEWIMSKTGSENGAEQELHDGDDNVATTSVVDIADPAAGVSSGVGSSTGSDHQPDNTQIGEEPTTTFFSLKNGGTTSLMTSSIISGKTALNATHQHHLVGSKMATSAASKRRFLCGGNEEHCVDDNCVATTGVVNISGQSSCSRGDNTSMQSSSDAAGLFPPVVANDADPDFLASKKRARGEVLDKSPALDGPLHFEPPRLHDLPPPFVYYVDRCWKPCPRHLRPALTKQQWEEIPSERIRNLVKHMALRDGEDAPENFFHIVDYPFEWWKQKGAGEEAGGE